MNPDDKENTTNPENDHSTQKNNDDYIFLSMRNHQDIEHLQVYLLNAFEDLTDMKTLCKALKIDVEDLDDMICNETDPE